MSSALEQACGDEGLAAHEMCARVRDELGSYAVLPERDDAMADAFRRLAEAVTSGMRSDPRGAYLVLVKLLDAKHELVAIRKSLVRAELESGLAKLAEHAVSLQAQLDAL